MSFYKKNLLLSILTYSSEILSIVLISIPWFNKGMNKPPLKYEYVFWCGSLVFGVLFVVSLSILDKKFKQGGDL